MNKVGVVIASTGGNKLLRCVRSLRRMEPDLDIFVQVDQSTVTYRMLGTPFDELQKTPAVYTYFVKDNEGYVNGGLNKAIELMQRTSHDYACLFQDDLIFSPLPEHRHSISQWFDHPLLTQSSGLRFSHFEALTPTVDLRRSPLEWDREDMEGEDLWRFLAEQYVTVAFDGQDINPPGRSFWFRYEGPRRIEKWNRLGPTGQIIPIATWEQVGRFNEHDGIFYDSEYPTECFLRHLPPVYAVTNFPFIHLHNQSVNPWADPARGVWSDTEGAFKKRYGGTREEIWWGAWPERWEGVEP